MVHLIVGNTGSGKTTYANALKRNNKGVIFSIDTWNNTLFFADKTSEDGLEWILERIERSEHMIKELIIQLEFAKTDSILDLGFSKFEHRETFRRFAKQNNFQLTTHFLDISKEVRFARVQKRNQEKGDTFEFEVSEDNFNFMEDWFEKPSEVELQNAIVITH